MFQISKWIFLRKVLSSVWGRIWDVPWPENEYGIELRTRVVTTYNYKPEIEVLPEPGLKDMEPTRISLSIPKYIRASWLFLENPKRAK